MTPVAASFVMPHSKKAKAYFFLLFYHRLERHKQISIVICEIKCLSVIWTDQS